MRYYVGFYTRQPQLVEDNLEDERLISSIEQSRSLFPFTRTLDLLLAKHVIAAGGTATIAEGITALNSNLLQMPSG